MSLETYLQMLTYRRPAGSKAERSFINRYILPLGVTVDGYGNLWKRIGTAPILWSSHTDTVHAFGGKQAIDIGEDGWITAPSSDCLGADCTTGVYLMAEMIRRGVEGLYVFHREEEIGGRGSAWIRDNTPELLDGIKFAIAFDRKDISSVITHQWDRCCSDDFADSLIAQLDPSFQRDNTGTFTDTANYTGLIGECTNLSVGYFDQHRPKERQHWGYMAWLLEAMCSLDVSALVSKREPGELDPDDWSFAAQDAPKIGWNTWEDTLTRTRTSKRNARRYLLDTILDHPDAVADILEEYGIASDDILHVANGGLVAAQ